MKARTVKKNHAIQSDFLIIGTGIAGLSYAIRVAEHASVNIITKKNNRDSNTNYAQGGIASVISGDDDIKFHIEDTASAGAGLCIPDAISFLARAGARQINQLLEWGVEFDRNVEGDLEVGREGGHSHHRIVHKKDYTGREIERALLKKAKSMPNIRFLENHFAIDLITDEDLKHKKKSRGGLLREEEEVQNCYGAYVLDIESNEVKTFHAKITMLSTGGAARVYQHSTNPNIATGDGIGMAFRAGAKIGNMEFYQFHPTTIYHPEGDSFLISEALRGYGALLKNKVGEAFMEKSHPLKCLAPRDIVARAIDREMKESGDPCVFLDITHKDPEETKNKFPQIYERCMELGIDMTQEWIPVVPAAHYMCGGVKVDLNSRTNLNRLYACGETSFTGVHGANRLASNSLLEAIVFSESASKDSIPRVKEIDLDKDDPEIPRWKKQRKIEEDEKILVEHNRKEIASIMWNYVGIVRTNERLHRARARFKLLKREVNETFSKRKLYPQLLELRNYLTTATLIVRSAIFRKESRGLHYTLDYPESKDEWLANTIIEKGKDPYLEPL